jgi:hypothetical protein
MAFAPPVSRDGFTYHGVLFVESSNDNRHPRASAAELTDLLRPKLGQKLSAPKDQVAHWYEAQLVHYGLPRVKDKNAAKIRLLNAINAGGLAVPDSIKKLEVSMKKEWDAANKKARAAEKKQEQATPQKKTNSTSRSEPKKNLEKPLNTTGFTSQFANQITNININMSSASTSRTSQTARKSAAPRRNVPQKSGNTAKQNKPKQTARMQTSSSPTKKSATRVNDKGGIQKPATQKSSTAKSVDKDKHARSKKSLPSDPSNREYWEAVQDANRIALNGAAQKATPSKKPTSFVKPTPDKKRAPAKIKREPHVKSEPRDEPEDEPYYAASPYSKDEDSEMLDL